MRSILVINPKGGCGKTTIATNLAGYYASRDKKVVLADFDPQASSMDWLEVRPEESNPIRGVAAYKETLRPGKKTDYLIMDAPAGIAGKELSAVLKRTESIILPVLPSALDMRATQRFIDDLKRMKKVSNGKVKLATVANRVRENTLVATELNKYLSKEKLPNGKKFPFVSVLRASQNYIRSAEKGLSIFELTPSLTYFDRDQWTPLLRWLNSARSRP